MSTELVYFEWKDHAMHGNWAEDIDAFHRPLNVKSVGWIMKEDDEGVTLAQSVAVKGDDDPPGNLLYLLKSCVLRRVKLDVV